MRTEQLWTTVTKSEMSVGHPPPPSPSPNTPVTALQEIVNILLYLLANKKRSAVKVVDVKPVEHKGEKRKLVLTEDGTVYN
jgi:hypothetical protein